MTDRRPGATDEAQRTRPRHPIRVVSTRTGLHPDVIRAWERRYGLVHPQRTATGRRLYSDADIERILLAVQAKKSGHSLKALAELSNEALRARVREDSVPPGMRAKAAVRKERRPLFTALWEACMAFDDARFDEALKAATLETTPSALCEEVLVPFLHHIGRSWEQGEFRPAQEHFASSRLMAWLGGVRTGARLPASAPAVVLGTPPGHLHELGAAMAAAAAVEEGWHPIYLGADLPAEDLALAVRRMRARVLGVSCVGSAGQQAVAAETMKQARGLLGDDVVIVAGGSGARELAAALSGEQVVVVQSLGEFRTVLRRVETPS